MPAQYLAIRNSLMKRGMSKDAAQAHAAAIYNSTHKKNPVTGHEKKKRHTVVGHMA